MDSEVKRRRWIVHKKWFGGSADPKPPLYDYDPEGIDGFIEREIAQIR